MPSINIFAKVNKTNYTCFSPNDFVGYEVYLASRDDFQYLPAMMEKLNIAAIHQPGRDFSLCNQNAKGEQSCQTIKELVVLLLANKFAGALVVHGNYFDEAVENRKDCLRTLASRLDELSSMIDQASGSIELSLETDVLFFNLIKSNRSLLAEPADFVALKKYLKSPLRLTIDFEHIWITAIFRKFMADFPRVLRLIKGPADLADPEIEQMKQVWLAYLSQNQAVLETWVEDLLKEYSALRENVVHFHINGTNPSGYWFDPQTFLPLIGEHLCIREGVDKLNYDLIKKYLPQLTALPFANLVMEIWPRNSSDQELYNETIVSSKLLKEAL